MAIIQTDPRLQDEEEQQQQGVISGTAGAPLAQQAPAPTQGTAATPQATQQPQRTGQAPRSGMATNVQQYVQKNQPAAQRMAGAVGGRVQTTADIARKGLQRVQRGFESQAQAGGIANQEKALGDVQNIVSGVATGAYQAPSPAGEVQPTQTAPQAQELTPDQQRFQQIINARYTGPQGLQDISGFGQAAREIREAGRLASGLTDPTQRQELLAGTLERPGQAYTSGQRRLDELLFSTGQPQEQLQQYAQQIGDVGEDLTAAQQQARQLGAGREQETQKIRQQARELFTDIASGRQEDVQARIGNVMENWDALPKHFQDALAQVAETGEIGALEAGTLGLEGDTRLFDLLDRYSPEELVGGVEAKAGQLISPEEQQQLSRLAALQRLGSGREGLGFQMAQDFVDPTQAGQQTALSALGLDRFGQRLGEAEERFRQGIGQEQVGRGRKKVSRGNIWGTKTETYTAEARENLQNILQQQREQGIEQIMAQDPSISRDQAEQLAEQMKIGYDPTQEIAQIQARPELLRKVSQVERGLSDLGIDTTDLSPTDMMRIAETEEGPLTLSSILAQGGSTGLFGGTMSEGLLGEGAQDFMQAYQKLINAPSQGLQNIGREIGGVGGDVGKFLGGGISEIGKAFGGLGPIDTGAMKAYGSSLAKQFALQNLQQKLEQQAGQLGVGNIARVADTEATQAREANLLDLLRNIDTTGLS